MAERPWLPEHPVDEALASALVRSQFPALAGAPVHLGSGFDNDVWRFGEVVFRFPRRAVAVPLIETEIRALPHLASHVPLAVPAPAFVGAPTSAFPYPFYGHPFLAGLTADRARLDDAARSRLAPALGEFLRTLHALDPGALAACGVQPDTFRGDVAGRSAAAAKRMPAFAGTPWAAYGPALAAILAAPPPAAPVAPVVLHGDLYARHVLLTGDRPAAVIDWGDLCLGDRAVDLAVAYSFLPPAARPAFWRAYGEVDPATKARARYLALARHGLFLPLYAADVGDQALAAEVDHLLANALAK